MQYILLFRGVNVGGHGKVPMAALRELLHTLGLANVQTYIQSGNAVVETDMGEAALHSAVKQAFMARFGFDGHLSICTIDAMRAVVQNLPFTETEIADAEKRAPDTAHVYVYFAPAPISQQLKEQLQTAADAGDALHVEGSMLYVFYRDSIRTSKTAQRIGKLLPDATARNWKTTLALLAMAEGRKP